MYCTMKVRSKGGRRAMSSVGGVGGGGGAGGYNSANYHGGAGGDGVVIISVPTDNYNNSDGTTGSPTITTSGTNTIVKFTSSGSYAP